MHGATIRHAKRKVGVTGDDQGKRVNYYADRHGLVFCPSDVICKSCDSKIYTYCRKTGFIDELKKRKTSNEVVEDLVREVEDAQNQFGADMNEDGRTSQTLREPSGRNIREDLESQHPADRSHGGREFQGSQVLEDQGSSRNADETPDIPQGAANEEAAEASNEMNLEDIPNTRSTRGVAVSGSRVSEDDSQRNAEVIYSNSESQASQHPVGSNRPPKWGFCNKKVKLEQVMSMPTTESNCCVCKSKQERKPVPYTAIFDLWKSNRIFCSKKNRACDKHFSNGSFTDAAIEIIRLKATAGASMTSDENSKLLNSITDAANDVRPVFDFDGGDVSERDHKLLLGLSGDDFTTLFGYIRHRLNESKNRKPKNCLAVFLCKLRLGLNQEVLARLFGLPDQPTVSKTIKRISDLLMEHFVPSNLGYTHLSREVLESVHNPTYVKSIFGVEDGNIALILDGTYLYIQQSSDHELQARTFSAHKHRNLVKYMMVTTPDGYIVEVEGSYFADGRNNDAAILSDMLSKENGISVFLKELDQLILDRGFRDAILELQARGYRVSMPELLTGNEKAFSTEAANLSRKVTLIRWSVESANGRIKNKFRFFDNIIPITYLPILGSLFRISCAIINRFSPPLMVETLRHIRLIDTVEQRVKGTNRLKDDIAAFDLDKMRYWNKVTSESVEGFPRLSREDLYEITCGVYQIRNAENYNARHLTDNSLYEVFSHREYNDILMVKLKSRFRFRSITHWLWISYTVHEDGAAAIKGYYCRCQVGSRVLGCCSHITAVLHFMGLQRHDPEVKKNRKQSYLSAILDAEDRKSRELQAQEEEEEVNAWFEDGFWPLE